MATELGQAYVQIMPSAKGISGSIQSAIGPEADAAGKSAGSLISSGMVATIASGLAAAGIGKIVTSALSAGGDLQQSFGGLDTLYAGAEESAKSYAKEAYKAGISANDYAEQAVSMGAALKNSLGGDAQKAVEAANMAIMDMADNAAKMGTPIESLQMAYQGFAKQNYTMLDNLKLGYGGTKTEMERLLADAEKLTGVKYDINNLADVNAAIHAIQEDLGLTGVAAQEAGSTFSGSLGAMKAAATNFLADLSLGNDIKPSLTALAETTANFLFNNLLPMLGNIVMAIPDVVTTFVETGIPMLINAGSQMLGGLGEGFVTGLPNLLVNIETMWTSMFSWINANMPQFLTVGTEFINQIVTGIINSIPQLLTSAGNVAASFLEFIMLNLPLLLEAGKNMIFNLVDGIIQNRSAIIDGAVGAVSTMIDTFIANLPQYLQTGWRIISELVTGLAQRYPQMATAGFELIGKLIWALLSKIPDLLGAVGQIGSNIIKSVTNIDLGAAGRAIMDSFLGGLKSAWGAVTNFVGGIAEWIKNNKGPISYDRKLLIPAGRAIMDSLHNGLLDNWGQIQSTVGGMANQIAGAFDDTSIQYSQRVQGIVSSSLLSDQVTSTARTDRDYWDIVSKLANRPIIISHQMDKQEMSRSLAQPISDEQVRRQSILSAVNGMGW